jgi:hypothetical protein
MSLREIADPTNQGSAPPPVNSDVSVENDIWHNTAECQGCADTWGTAAAGGTGVIVALPVLLPALFYAGENLWVTAGIVEAAYPGCLGEFPSGLAPVPSGASTSCYAMEVSIGGIYDYVNGQ